MPMTDIKINTFKITTQRDVLSAAVSIQKHKSQETPQHLGREANGVDELCSDVRCWKTRFGFYNLNTDRK